jgi:hypothetical protein
MPGPYEARRPVALPGVRPNSSDLTSGPVGAVEGAVLNGLAQVPRLNALGGIQVGDGPRYFQDPVVGPSGKSQAGNGVLQQLFSFCGYGATLRIILGIICALQ